MFHGKQILSGGENVVLFLSAFLLPRFSRISSPFFVYLRSLSVLRIQHDGFRESKNDKQFARTYVSISKIFE